MSITRFSLVGIIMLLSISTMGAADATGPYEVVEQTTQQVLAIVKETQNSATKDSKRFNGEVTAIMERVTDFDGFARSVMGTYASGQRYKTLTTEADRAAFRERIQRFSDVFKQGIVDTYASSLLDFKGQKIETLPPRKGEDLSTGSTMVTQYISNESGKPYVVQYSMRRNKAGEWKLYNLIIEGVNLGLTYRNQFAASADNYKGDLDKVITNWKVDPDIINQNKSTATNPETNK